jgi:predicted transcriptional regulator
MVVRSAKGLMMKGIRFRSNQQGIRASLFDLEADIMEVVWSKGWELFSVADVHRELERNRDIAYTTVMTTVSRLHDKELLNRERDGRRYVYRPRLSREAFLREMTREVLHSLSDVGREEAVAYLVERVSEADTEELARLEALILARRREMKP